MASRDKRARATGRLGVERGERYALISEEVLTSAAYAAVPDFGKIVLFAVASRFNGHNNGSFSLPFSEARTLGVPHQWKLFAGLTLLKQTGLIICTRQGKLERGTKLCSLYAIAWRGIDAAPAHVSYDAGVSVCPIASTAWAKWQPPPDWQQIVKAVKVANHGKKKNPVSTTVGYGRSTTVGAINSHTAQPRGGKGSVAAAPSMVDASKTPPRGGHDGSDQFSRSQPPHARPVANRNLRISGDRYSS